MHRLSINNNPEAVMKRNFFAGILAAEAAACVVLCIIQASFEGVFSAAIAFPFEQIGSYLRALSLSGTSGNVVAVAIYFAVSLSPAAVLLILRKRRGLRAEDGLLGLLSAVLFAVLYFMVNPGLVGALAGGETGQSVGKAVLGGVVYSVLCGYFVLRVLRLFSLGGTDKLAFYMTVMLNLLNVLFVYLAFGACFDGLLNSIAALRAGNTGNEHLLNASYVFLVLRFVADALPYILDVFVVFAALRLLDEMRADRYSAETVAAAERVSKLCGTAVAVAILSNIGLNVLQLLFLKSLMVVNSSVQIPVFSITFVLAALLLTRLVTENKQLKDDNDMFV